MAQEALALKVEQEISSVETYKFESEPVRGLPELHWRGKRPFTSTQFYPAQLKENHGQEVNGWMNKIFWGDNLQVMSHLIKQYRAQVNLVYIDPPFDSKADYKRKISLRGKSVTNSNSAFEEKQYTDIWSNDEYLQFIYERLILIRELLAPNGVIYLHCDYRKVHHIRCIMDQIFGPDNFLNSIVWMFSTRSSIKTSWKRSHHDILLYKKGGAATFNWDDEMVIEPLSESTIKKYRLKDDNGYYRLNGRFIKDSPIKGAKDVDPKWEQSNPDLVVRDYLRDGKVANDYFFIDIENQASDKRTDYPTQKPEELLYKLISASSKPGDLIFDCFMGSGTTLSVAMKLGRRFIGADINLGSVHITTSRLLNNSKDITSTIQELTSYTGFSVYNVNHYDIFRNPIQAKDILIKALEIQPLPNHNIYDGEKDERMVKIMPINRIATRADLNELITNFDYKEFEKISEKSPGKPVESLLLVCMGHEPDLAASLQNSVPYKLDIEVVDILRDSSRLEFKRDAEAEIIIEGNRLVICDFYPMNLLQKLSLAKEEAAKNWKELVDSVMIDFNYDGSVFEPSTVDVPEDNELVRGVYNIPANAGTIRVKITDILSETLEQTVQNG